MKATFNVLNWGFNSDELEYYDVLPYFRDCYKKEKNKPRTFEDLKEFIRKQSMYKFWSRCEYEIICQNWPATNKKYKLDVHEQIMMNLDIIAEILYKEINNK